MTEAKALTPWQEFEHELDERAQSIFSMLPSNISPDKFRNTAISAVKQNPELLQCTPRSLFSAITRAAQDGIMPDGKEGVIGTYNTNVAKKGQPDKWERQAQWNPMFWGLRKRARELDGLLVDAQVVHEKDHFVWHQGDDPRIEHEPAKLGTDRGKMIGAYAIFKREDKTIIAREVMDFKSIDDVRQQSKQPDGLMWKKFTTEAWRKTVGRRGFKSVPVSEGLQAIIQRDDEANFEFDRHEVTTALTPPPAPPPAPKVENKPGVTLEVPPVKEAEKVPIQKEQEAPPKQQAAPIANPDLDYSDYLQDCMSELAECKTEAAVEDLRDRVLLELRDEDVSGWKSATADKATELFNVKKK